MRVRANLTGKEYAKLMEFLRRWHDVPAPTPPDAPSPKRFTFGQPIAELRDQTTPPQPPGNPGLPPNDVGKTPAPSGQQPSAVVPAAATAARPIPRSLDHGLPGGGEGACICFSSASHCCWSASKRFWNSLGAS
jgi:hypothetical protein